MRPSAYRTGEGITRKSIKLFAHLSKRKNTFDEYSFLKFLKEWYRYCVVIAVNYSRKIQFNDDSIIHSACHEALYCSFLEIEDMKSKHIFKETITMGILRNMVKHCVYDQLLYFGLKKSRCRVWFPSGWVSWEDYFSEQATDGIDFSEKDLISTMEFLGFNEMEIKMMKLKINGYTAIEIKSKLGISKKRCELIMSKLTKQLHDSLDPEIKKLYKRCRNVSIWDK